MKDYFDFAFQSIRHRALRSGLTILGIIVGIAAIVALISISQGLEHAISEQFKGLGSNKVYLFPKGVGAIFSATDETGLGDSDVNVLEGLSETDYVNSYLFEKVEVTHANEDIFTSVTGYESEKDPIDVFEGQGIKLSEGRWFSRGEKGSVIIGSKLEEEIFKKDIFLGSRLEIGGEKYKVIGIMNSLGNEEDDTNIWMHMDDARAVHNEPDKIGFLEVVAKDGTDMPSFAEKIKRSMKRARDEDDVEVFIPEQILKQLGNILGVVQVVLAGIAAISLLVGGIGIMNSMYTNVLERKKEIGILKAIGATPSTIKRIFLVEAGIIGFAGGVLGSVLGVAVSLGVGALAKSQGFILLDIQIEWIVIILSILFALGIGMFAGYLPAREASKLLPVEALRE
jgi:putative ABC transport system permease protein